jgi:heptaprenyl diphosphate synthase
MGNKSTTKKMVLLSILVALGVVFSLVDGFITTTVVSTIPFLAYMIPAGFKIGLANIVILIIVLNFRFKDGLITVILKSFLVSFIFGHYITFAIGFSGTILSFLIMYGIKQISKGNVNIVVLSLIGAVAHTTGQIVGAGVFALYGWGVIGLIPQTLSVALIAGFFMGVIAKTVNTYLQNSYLLIE